MKTRGSLSWLGLIVIMVCLLAQPAGVLAQCMVSNTTVSDSVAMGSPYTEVMKTLNGTYLCNRVMSSMVSLCAPGAAMNRMTLTASAPAGTTNPSCEFYCTGGAACVSIVIDGSDGLPVELMDFGFEDEQSVEGE